MQDSHISTDSTRPAPAGWAGEFVTKLQSCYRS